MELLCEYNFDVHYIEGKENVVVDALSRRHHELNYPTHDLELGVVFHALEQWHYFLLG